MFGEGTLAELEAAHKENKVPDRLRTLSDQEVVLIEQALDFLAEQPITEMTEDISVATLDRLRREFTHENTQRLHAARRQMVVA